MYIVDYLITNMDNIHLSPGEILYSQCSIDSKFSHGPYAGEYIGDTLDSLLCKECVAEDIPSIVVQREGQLWFTGDNRRLWVFKMAARLGAIDVIPVIHGYIPNYKLTTKSKGLNINVQGHPGGQLWKSLMFGDCIDYKIHNMKGENKKKNEKRRISVTAFNDYNFLATEENIDHDGQDDNGIIDEKDDNEIEDVDDDLTWSYEDYHQSQNDDEDGNCYPYNEEDANIEDSFYDEDYGSCDYEDANDNVDDENKTWDRPPKVTVDLMMIVKKKTVLPLNHCRNAKI